MASFNQTELIQVISERLDVTMDSVTPQASFLDDLGADSRGRSRAHDGPRREIQLGDTGRGR
jgi:hypothetical protein